MKRRTSKQPARRAARRSGVAAPPGSAAEAASALPEQPDLPDCGPAQRIAPLAADDQARSDIERASERRSGSLETVPHPAPAPGLASFGEAPEADGAQAGMPPHLREG